MEDVLVIGAGPVGLTAACQLARFGVGVRVVDALDEPTTESRAVGVHARSLEMLAALGVLPALEARGRRIGALAMLDGATGDVRARITLDDIASRHPYILDVAQPDTEAVLADRAADLGVRVERGVRLTALDQDDDGVTATLSSRDGDDVSEEVVRVGWVIGADGGHSATRRLLGTHLEGSFHGQHFAMADVDVDTDLPPDAIRLFTHPEGMAMLFPLAGARARVMFLVADPGPHAPDPTLAEIQALADTRMAGRVRVHHPRWLTYFEIHHAQVPRYRHGRVLLAGDAAHIHSPAGAQGMNTGMQDAANLAWKLALVTRGQAGPRLLDSYHDERHPVGAQVVRTTTVLTDVGAAAGALGAVRDAALFLVGHLGHVRDTAATQLSEVAIGYRHSALSRTHGRHGVVRAGDHAPDPDGLQGADGTPVALEDLLARPGFLLLTHDPTTELTETLGQLGSVLRLGVDLHDPDAAYGDHGMTLVRPDGYVGLVSDTTDPEVLRRYLVDALGIARPARV